MNQKIVLWLSRQPEQTDRPLIGPKAVGLCTLLRLGMRVPPCFFLTTNAFREHLDANDLRSRMASLLHELDLQPNAKPGVIEEICQHIARAPLTDYLREQVAAAYGQLGATVVAVRSSATAEDLSGHSFAGQYETILGVTSLNECLTAVKQCWASLWTERAFEYRRRNGIEHLQVEMAVIVQEQIEPDAAGVAFTLDPVTGSRSRIVIEACAGLGEALVSGRVQPDRFIIRKKDLEIIRQIPSDGQGRGPVLAPDLAKVLARFVIRIEKGLGCPQDVEWAIRDGRLWFLQARPITAIPRQKPWEDQQVWTNTNTGEVIPDVMTPITWSMIQLLFNPLFRSIFRLVGVDADRAPVAGLVAGRVYFNINTGLAAGRPFGLGPDNAAQFEGIFGGKHIELYHLGQVDISEEDLPDLGFNWPGYIFSWPRIVYDLLTHLPKRGQKARTRLRVRNDALLGLDLEAMDTADLSKTFRESLWNNTADLDMLYLVTSAPGILVFEKACRDWLGDPDLNLGYRLLAAQGGMADTEAGLDLWRIAELVHADKETEAVVLFDLDWQALQARLSGTEGGRRFLLAWDRFMAEHGHHCRGELEFFNARWFERPEYILDWLRSSLRSIGTLNPLARQRQLAIDREALTGQCLRRLRNPVKRRLFVWSLKRVQRLAVERENWKNEIVRQLAALRRVLLVLGSRFQREGLVSHADDIFFLDLSEIETLAQGHINLDVGQRIAERRVEYERNRAFTPPPVVVGRFDPNTYVGPQVEADVRELKGIAVSPGVVSGKARVILRTDEHQHVEAGEILVAPFTDPAWTPYFLPAAGVVMDQGGVLSHGAIIAREYGIPAVVNVGPATKIIRTGQQIRVDGDRGIVTILDAQP